MLEIAIGLVAARVVGAVLDSAGAETGSSVVKWVKGHFSASSELQRVEEAPDSPRRIEALGHVIDDAVTENIEFKNQLQGLLDELGEESPKMIQNVTGDQNVNAYHSTVTITSSQPATPTVDLRIEWHDGGTYQLINRGDASALNVTVMDFEQAYWALEQNSFPRTLRRGESILFGASFGSPSEAHVLWEIEDGEIDDRWLRLPSRQS